MLVLQVHWSAATLEPPALHSVGLPYDTKIDHWAMATGHSQAPVGDLGGFWESIFHMNANSQSFSAVSAL